ncbi:MAG TPA: TOBE domain-containing protein [Azospirillaceae bacterium]|nr:TOBE domain-containing protein [Azospirillaceae bacterium]
MSFRAQISLAADGAAPMGETRVRLLEAVGREGSISAAARAVGLSYKAAWDAVDAMNNLFGRPLVGAQTGGRKGGGATLTPDGVRVIETYHRLAAELSRALQELEPSLADAGFTPSDLMWRFMMKTSARNALRATVAAVREEDVGAEVSLDVADGVSLTSVITRDSLKELGLFPGRPCTALIKSSFVLFAVGEGGIVSARNRIPGVVARREDGKINAEIVLDIGGGKTLTGVVMTSSADELDLTPGRAATALIEPAHVILAVE